VIEELIKNAPCWLLSDLDDQAGLLIGYDRRYQQQGSGEFRGQFAARHLGEGLSIFAESGNLQLFQRARVPEDAYSLHVVFSTKFNGILNGQCIGEDTLVLLPGGASFDYTSSPDAHTCTIRFAKELLCDVIPIGLTCGIFATDRPFAHELRTLIRRTMGEPAVPAAIPPGATDCALSAELCAVARRFILAHGHRTPAKRAERVVYKKALTLIDSKLDGPIRIADLCRSVGASRRMLENAFVANMGHGPATYIRLLRLNGIRRRMTCERHRDRTIGDIAAQMGIWHLGRLSRDFRTLFGVSPHQFRQRTKGA